MVIADADAKVALVAIVIASTSCNCNTGPDECPRDLLPGICARRLAFTELYRPLDGGALVDVNGDGVRELVGHTEKSLMVANFSGGLSINGLPGSYIASAIGDFDGNSDHQVALLRRDSSSADLFAVGPDGLERELEPIELGGLPRGLWAADLDADGRDELLSVDSAEAAVVVVTGVDRSISRHPAGVGPASLLVAELDGDGNPDVIVADFVASQLQLLLGDGSGGFSSPIGVATTLGVNSLGFGDVNGDGVPDIVVRGGLPEFWVHPGEGGGAFATPFAVPTVDSERDARGLAILSPGDDGLGGVVVPEGDDLSTWLVAEGSTIGRSRRSAPGGRITSTGAAEWLVLGYGAELVIPGDGPLPIERWRQGVVNQDLEAWGPGAVADVDGDGSEDLIALHSTTFDADAEANSAAEILLSVGDGTLESGGVMQMPAVLGLLAGDFDGDESMDLIGVRSPSELWLSRGGTDASHEIRAPGGESPQWVPLAVLTGPDRAQLIVEVQGEGRVLAVVSLGADGAATDVITLAPGVVVSTVRVSDLDSDGDEDIVVLGVTDDRLVLQGLRSEGGGLVNGPIHDVASLTGWDASTSPTGFGVEDLDDNGEAEVLLTSSASVAHITGVLASPAVELDDATAPPEERVSALDGRVLVPRLISGDLDGDGERDLMRVTDGCDVWLGSAGHLSGAPARVPLPKGWIDAAQLDEAAPTDFFVVESSGVSTMVTTNHTQLDIAYSWPDLRPTRITPVAADLDGDSALELVVATPTGVATIWRPGSGDQHIEWTSTSAPVRTMALAHVDGGHDAVYLGVSGNGVGVGAFGRLEVTEGRVRVQLVGPLGTPSLRATSPFLATDLDGDGEHDLVGDTEAGLTIAYGVAPLVFDEPVVIEAPRPRALFAGDLDGDGRAELVERHVGGITILWNRAGRLWDVEEIEAEDAALVDGRLLVRRGAQLKWVTSESDGRIQGILAGESDTLVETDGFLGGGDLDGDGRTDLVTLHREKRIFWLVRDDALEAVHEEQGSFGPSLLVDLDGGGHADLVEISEYGFGVPIRWGEGAP